MSRLDERILYSTSNCLTFFNKFYARSITIQRGMCIPDREGILECFSCQLPNAKYDSLVKTQDQGIFALWVMGQDHKRWALYSDSDRDHNLRMTFWIFASIDAQTLVLCAPILLLSLALTDTQTFVPFDIFVTESSRINIFNIVLRKWPCFITSRELIFTFFLILTG